MTSVCDYSLETLENSTSAVFQAHPTLLTLPAWDAHKESYSASCSRRCCAFAQDTDYHHNNFIVGVGPAIPVGSTTNYLSTAPFVNFGYGYRFNRWFQADAGFQIAFGAANNHNAEITDIGAVQGGDHEFMIPLRRASLHSAAVSSHQLIGRWRRRVSALLRDRVFRGYGIFVRLLLLYISRRLGRLWAGQY